MRALATPAPSRAWGWGRGAAPSFASHTKKDQGIRWRDSANIVPIDANGLAFSRTTGEVLSIVYLGGAGSDFGFFPNRLNGTIK